MSKWKDNNKITSTKFFLVETCTAYGKLRALEYCDKNHILYTVDAFGKLLIINSEENWKKVQAYIQAPSVVLKHTASFHKKARKSAKLAAERAYKNIEDGIGYKGIYEQAFYAGYMARERALKRQKK